MANAEQPCSNCGQMVRAEIGSHRYEEIGLSNVILQGVELLPCGACGHTDVVIPQVRRVHREIAKGLALMSRRRLTGFDLRFLRSHLEISREDFARQLSVNATEVLCWERDGAPLSEDADRRVRSLVIGLEVDGSAAAEGEAHLSYELHVDVNSLTHAQLSLSAA